MLWYCDQSLDELGPDFGIDSYHLGIPDESDALEIVTAFSKVDWRQQPDSVRLIFSRMLVVFR